MTLHARFHAKHIPEPNCGCWLWFGAVNKDGYGQIRDGRRAVLAHRVAWELTAGPVADGLCVLHRCDMPACVNPEHLFLGTQLQNIRDMHAKGRARQKPALPGAKHPNARISDADVRAIRASDEPRAVLAARYAIHPMHVSRIRAGKRWAKQP